MRDFCSPSHAVSAGESACNSPFAPRPFQAFPAPVATFARRWLLSLDRFPQSPSSGERRNDGYQGPTLARSAHRESQPLLESRVDRQKIPAKARYYERVAC